MRTRSSLLFMVFAAAIMLCAGCASTKEYTRVPDLTKRVEDPARARIYLMRTAKVLGDGVAVEFAMTEMAEDGSRSRAVNRYIGKLGPGHYLCWETPPRRVKLELVQGDPGSVAELDLVAGQVYYLRVSLRTGFVGPKATLDVLTDNEGEALLKRCKAPDR